MKRRFFIFLITAIIFAAIPFCLFKAHHFIVTGLNPLLSIIPLFILLILILPASIYFGIKITAYTKDIIQFTTSLLFEIGSFSLFITYFISNLLYGSLKMKQDAYTGDNFILKDTPFLIAFLVFAAFGIIYARAPKFFGRPLNKQMGHVHFWITIVCVYTIYGQILYSHYLPNQPPHQLAYRISPYNNEVFNESIFIKKASMLLMAAQLLFVFNILYSTFMHKNSASKMKDQN